MQPIVIKLSGKALAAENELLTLLRRFKRPAAPLSSCTAAAWKSTAS